MARLLWSLRRELTNFVQDGVWEPCKSIKTVSVWLNQVAVFEELQHSND